MDSKFLSNVPLFHGLAIEDLDKIAAISTRKTVRKNTILMNEGDAGDSAYIIISGKVNVYVSDEEGRQLVLDSFGPGACFGELALIDGEPRSASIITTEECVFSLISQANFGTFVVNNPHIALNLLRALAERLRSVNENIKSLALLDVYGRVASAIIRMATRQGDEWVTEAITHQEIADRVGASREMVSRVLAGLKQDGYIDVTGKVITIHQELPIHQ